MNTDQTEKVEANSPAPKTAIMAAITALWLGGFGALAVFTAPSDTANPAYLPASAQTLDPQADAMDKLAQEGSVDFIVKFHKVDAVEDCLETFKTDPEAARGIFENWASNYDKLDGMQLSKTSYAGEMILSWSTQDGARPNRADILAKQSELQAMDEVKYADPDYTAHIGD